MPNMQGLDQSNEQTVAEMIEGFDSLLDHVETLRAKNADLQQQLQSLRKKSLITPAATEDGKTCPRGHGRREDVGQDSDNTLPLESRSIRKARDIAKRWHAARPSDSTEQASPTIELPDGHPQIDEQDFTTPGAASGRLGCPFAAMMAEKDKLAREHDPQNRSRRPSSGKVDPIAAEFHTDNPSSPPASTSGGSAKCPIRFLDQHKPEEVAQYFENHKHEIPRSHEICIKRYQTNEASIRELDEKYGSLVNMIQGLGKRHKPMLPETPDEVDEDDASQILSDKGVAKIENWAGNVVDEPGTEPTLSVHVEDQTREATSSIGPRTPRFERDLREVRLGESPSRPWGIQIPEAAEAEERNSVRSVHSARATQSSLKDTRKSPPASSASLDATRLRHSMEEAGVAGSTGPKAPMLFNGPVFFGYSADEVAHLLREVPALQTQRGSR